MTAPTRPERRRELKEIDKKLIWLQKHSNFSKFYSLFSPYNTEQVQVFVDGKWEDEALQEKFNEFKTLWDAGVGLSNRKEYLKVGYGSEPKENIATI